MDIDFQAYVEQTLDNFRHRIMALEEAVTQIPAIDFEKDVSRPEGVRVAPQAVDKRKMVIPPNG